MGCGLMVSADNAATLPDRRLEPLEFGIDVNRQDAVEPAFEDLGDHDFEVSVCVQEDLADATLIKEGDDLTVVG